jgi:hypothetical protein
VREAGFLLFHPLTISFTDDIYPLGFRTWRGSRSGEITHCTIPGVCSDQHLQMYTRQGTLIAVLTQEGVVRRGVEQPPSQEREKAKL